MKQKEGLLQDGTIGLQIFLSAYPFLSKKELDKVFKGWEKLPMFKNRKKEL